MVMGDSIASYLCGSARNALMTVGVSERVNRCAFPFNILMSRPDSDVYVMEWVLTGGYDLTHARVGWEIGLGVS